MMKALNSKKNYILAMAIFFVVVSLSGPTYSLFLKTDDSNPFNYNTGILDLQLIEDTKILLENSFPTIDSDGLKTKPYTLTIKNTGTLNYLFDLKMLSTIDENTIDSKYIKISVNGLKPSTLALNDGFIAKNLTLYPNESLNINIQVWLDNNTPNAELGKTFEAKILTTGTAIYRTLDTSGANHPSTNSEMIPVYYDDTQNVWRKADKSNLDSNNEWYNYDNKKWANIVKINNSNKQIYDVTNKNNIIVEDIKHDNGAVIIENNFFDLKNDNFNSSSISNFMKIKFNNLTEDKKYIISNGNISYYYDNIINKFAFKVNDHVVTSSTFDIEKNKWYIIGYTYNGNTITYYVDGTKLSSSNIVGSISSGKSFKLGTNDLFTKTSNISINNIYFYNDILSDDEISTNYKDDILVIQDNLFGGYNSFNPMTLMEYYLSSDLGTIINNDDINSFYVWIPRYKYMLWNVTGESSIDSYDAINKGINITFEHGTTSSGVIYCRDYECYNDDKYINKVSIKDNGKYYTHPVFDNFDSKLTGIWVSKYELSTNDSECLSSSSSNCVSTKLPVIIKPNTPSWRNNSLSNYYQAIKKLGNNYYMIKNTEWGAITYLANSKYGICSDNKCQSFVPNKTYISGNEKNDSTTSNIYGIFDLNGGGVEYVMANYANQNGEASFNNSSFNNLSINTNDYDLYQNNNFILGDATSELGTQNVITKLSNINNWLTRGGSIDKQSLFKSFASDGQEQNYITTRIIIK